MIGGLLLLLLSRPNCGFCDKAVGSPISPRRATISQQVSPGVEREGRKSEMDAAKWERERGERAPMPQHVPRLKMQQPCPLLISGFVMMSVFVPRTYSSALCVWPNLTHKAIKGGVSVCYMCACGPYKPSPLRPRGLSRERREISQRYSGSPSDVTLLGCTQQHLPTAAWRRQQLAVCSCFEANALTFGGGLARTLSRPKCLFRNSEVDIRGESERAIAANERRTSCEKLVAGSLQRFPLRKKTCENLFRVPFLYVCTIHTCPPERKSEIGLYVPWDKALSSFAPDRAF